jgi:type II secretory pathway pseudopilin PulG
MATCAYCAEPMGAGEAVCKTCGERQPPPGAAPSMGGAPPTGGSRAPVIVILVVVVLVGGLCVVGFLAALLMPALMKAKSKANRTKCANDLRVCGLAMIQYADDKRFYPHVRAASALDGDVATSDSPKIARTLLYFDYMDAPDDFTCPETLDAPAPRTTPPSDPRSWFWGGQTIPPGEASPIVDGQADPTLDQTTELSYGWTRRALSMNAPSDARISADRARRDPAAAPSGDALSGNHLDGWNVGNADGTVRFVNGALDPTAGAALVATDPADRASGFLCVKPQ